MAWAQIVKGAINGANELIKGRQQANELRDQAEVVQQNIDRTVMNREIQGQQYSAREEGLRRNIRAQLGNQRAQIAESGTGFGGTNLQLQRQSTATSELDVLNLRYQGELERMGMDIDIANLRYNKQALRKAAKTAMRMRWHNAAAAFFGAGTVNSSGGTSAPTASPGAYGQGSMMNFGNNMGGFTSTSSGGFTGGGLGAGYGSTGGYSGLFGGG